MQTLILLGFLAVVLIVAYWFLVRPWVKNLPFARQTFHELDSWYTKLFKSFKGLKTKLSAWALMVAGAAVTVHDAVLPSMTNYDITPITSKIPHDLYPVLAIAVGALFRILRKVTTSPEA